MTIFYTKLLFFYVNQNIYIFGYVALNSKEIISMN